MLSWRSWRSAAARGAALTRPVDDRTPATAAVESPSAAPRRMMLRRESRRRIASSTRESTRGSLTEFLLATEWLGHHGRGACAQCAGAYPALPRPQCPGEGASLV